MRDFLVGPSAASSNGNIADERIKWRCPVRGLRNSRNLRKNRAGVVRLERSVTKLRGLNAKRHHYYGEFRSINDFILRNWGACVDTIFGHVPKDR